MTPNLSAPKSPDPVRRAVLQLRAWGGEDLNQGQVRRILPTWRHYGVLSPDEMLAVVGSFPPGEDPDQSGVMQRGGWISGSAQTGGADDDRT